MGVSYPPPYRPIISNSGTTVIVSGVSVNSTSPNPMATMDATATVHAPIVGDSHILKSVKVKCMPEVHQHPSVLIHTILKKKGCSKRSTKIIRNAVAAAGLKRVLTILCSQQRILPILISADGQLNLLKRSLMISRGTCL